MGTPRVSASLDQMRRMQVAASGGGECARTGMVAQTIGATVNGWSKLLGAAATTSSTCCLAAPFCANGCEAEPVFFSDTAQQVMFAQQLLLQASWLGPFERMHDTAGNCNDVVNIASTTANKIAAVFRIG